MTDAVAISTRWAALVAVVAATMLVRSALTTAPEALPLDVVEYPAAVTRSNDPTLAALDTELDRLIDLVVVATTHEERRALKTRLDWVRATRDAYRQLERARAESGRRVSCHWDVSAVCRSNPPSKACM